MADNYMQVLLETITKKEETLKKILEITKLQEEYSKRDVYPTEEMEKTLNEKDIQIGRLNYLDEGFQSVYDRVRLELRNHKEDYKSEILELQERIRVCTELGNQIQVLEDRNRNRFSVLFTQTKKKYSASKSQANVAQNYAKVMNKAKILDSYFVDKKK